MQQVAPDLVSTTSALLNASDTAPTQLLEVNYSALTFVLINAIKEIATISGTFQQNLIAWLGNADNGITDLFAKNLYATNVTADNITANRKLCVDDGANDSNPVCVTKSQLAAVLASQGAGASGTESATPLSGDDTAVTTTDATTTPPQIQINDNNPAIIQVGDTYNDLGATITGPTDADKNLGIQFFVDGAPVDTISIDTSVASTHTIDYVATDTSGLTSTSTRTIVIQPANDNAVSSTEAATTDATSTAQ